MSKHSKPPAPAPKIEVNRSSISGRFVTPEYAERHPKTTETEHYRRPAPDPKKK